MRRSAAGATVHRLKPAFGSADISGMEASGTWLCPTAFDRERLLEMEAKLRRPRAIMYGSLAIVSLIADPLAGLVDPAVRCSVRFSATPLLQPLIATSERPEYVVGSHGGERPDTDRRRHRSDRRTVQPGDPAPAASDRDASGALFREGRVAGVGITVVVLLGRRSPVDPGSFADDPTYTLIGLAAIAGSLPSPTP